MARHVTATASLRSWPGSEPSAVGRLPRREAGRRAAGPRHGGDDDGGHDARQRAAVLALRPARTASRTGTAGECRAELRRRSCRRHGHSDPDRNRPQIASRRMPPSGWTEAARDSRGEPGRHGRPRGRDDALPVRRGASRPGRSRIRQSGSTSWSPPARWPPRPAWTPSRCCGRPWPPGRGCKIRDAALLALLVAFAWMNPMLAVALGRRRRRASRGDGPGRAGECRRRPQRRSGRSSCSWLCPGCSRR